MATTFAILAQGSAFMHASKTDNGAAADVRLNDLFAYVAYQAAIKNLLPLESSIIHDLSPVPRFIISAHFYRISPIWIFLRTFNIGRFRMALPFENCLNNCVSFTL